MTQYIEFTSNHPMLVIAFFVNALLIIYIEYGRRTALYKNISAQEATVLQNHESAIFLDIREKAEYAQGHLINSISIPVKSLLKVISQLSKYKDKPIIVYCASGNRSIQGSKILTGQEFSQVYNLSGGIHAWQKSNLPVTKR
jgi:rhodanese-related sulfurtransferase